MENYTMTNLEQDVLDAAINDFVKKAQDLVNTYTKSNYPTLVPDLLTTSTGKSYTKVIRNSVDADGKPTGGGRSVYCFIDNKNGDVLKAAGWAAPAKGKRSNIFDADNGVSGITAYGAVYHR
jgi:hypothetical protein